MSDTLYIILFHVLCILSMFIMCDQQQQTFWLDDLTINTSNTIIQGFLYSPLIEFTQLIC